MRTPLPSRKLTIKTGKNTSKHSSVASLYRALADAALADAAQADADGEHAAAGAGTG